MATYNLNVTASVDLLGSDISGSQSTDFAIANPLSGSSYFTFETVRNSDGFYDSSSPKNMAGTYTLGAGLAGVVKSDYIASVVVEPGGGTLTFVPTNYISGSSLNLRGTTSPPQPTDTGFDADYQAVLNYATTQGYTLPSSGQQTLQNQLLVDLKAAGVWSKLDTFAVFATDGDSDFALIDWINLSQYTAYNSPTFTSNSGFFGDGVSAYIDTNFNPSTSGINFTLNDASFGGVKTINLANNGYFTGTIVSGQNLLRGSSTSANRINQGTNSFTPTADFSSYYFVGLHRDSSTTGAFTYDNSTTSATANSVSIPNSNQFILRYATVYSNYGARMFWMGGELIAENSDFYTAWYNYYNAI